MFKKILIANRGEIALTRDSYLQRNGHSYRGGIFYSADKDSLHVRFADEAVCIGKPAGADSYLNIPHIMAAAEITNADAIHPGYGFLSENAKFAEICGQYNINLLAHAEHDQCHG
jgi:acetyl-CoA carboxylase biotin carboxylase subunit